MATAQTLVPLLSAQHLVLSNVSWGFYEKVLEEAGNDPVRVTFDRGRIEIMSPLPKHDRFGRLLGQLLLVLCLERRIEMTPFGSTTFRDARKLKGLEPDECFYIQHVEQSRQITEGFDPTIHPPPDLAIEVDITSRSIEREPIYAALGVPELWRVRVGSVQCLHLSGQGSYEENDASLAFPFLRPAELWDWIVRLRDEGSVATMPRFQPWVRGL